MSEKKEYAADKNLKNEENHLDKDSCDCNCGENKTSTINDQTCSIDEENHDNFCSCCSGDLLEEKDPLWKRKHFMVIVISSITFGLGLYFDFFTPYSNLAQILFLLVVIISGYNTIKSGLKSLLKGRFTINILISLAALGAFFIGEGAEGASVLLLFYVAEYLEDYASGRARKSIKSLLELAPVKALVRKNGEMVKMNIEEVNVHDIVVVKPGDKIPVDGKIIEGLSHVNQAAITGESIPISKKIGDTVFAGTINEEGYLEVEVNKKSTETVISKIIDLVKEAQNKKSKTELFIERFARYYTPSVILMAVMVVLVPTFILGQSFETWFYRALVLLVVSCPCALAISTPVAMVSGITAATKKGLLIKGGEFMEEMQNIETIVFDKTGTLTMGKLEVTDVMSINDYTSNEILSIAMALESKSQHPLARAIINYAKKQSLKTINNSVNDNKSFKVKEFKSLTGKGLKGKIDNDTFYIGQKSLFKDLDLSPEWDKHVKPKIIDLENQGKTAIILGTDKKLMGIFGLMDKIRDNSITTVDKLKQMNIHTMMLTGDNEGTAQSISSSIGLDEYRSNLLPQDKVEIVEKLLKEGKHVAMVGDGVNDAPALARSNIGIAMGVAGSDVAIETADVALMNDDISLINYLMDLSKRTMFVVKQNVTASIIIKSSFALMTVFGFVSLWMAVAIGDMGLSLAVIINALRIGSK
ncbi:MAG: cation-translocating P-type ATPase [Methanobacteriaceae archaeon]|nr:cation-translocating P-type ATPase [Methanobacteriaceae archaeon]